MLVSDFYHLTYCTNIHPGENWEVTFKNLQKHVPAIKNKISEKKDFGLGLRLSNTASAELGLGQKLKDFKDWLHKNGIYVFTMNGFPYGNFHGERVKDNVHQPDWGTRARLQYTQRLFEQLVYLLPDSVSGGISTSPISYKHWHATEEEKHKVMRSGAQNMIKIAEQLYQLEKETGKYLHLDIEPEPDGLLENSNEVVDFYAKYLIPLGLKTLGENLSLDKEEAEKCIKRYLTVCYDICHFSLAFEEPKETFAKFADNGIQIGKIQISAALKILAEGKDIGSIWRRLKDFDEPTYLHQVTEREGEQVRTYADLPIVIDKKNDFKELRAHFHVPIFLESFDVLNSTQDHIVKTLELLNVDPVCNHLEIETYTWEVLPKSLKIPISESIAREINWLKEKL
nr:metabolite traffic protein EboE [Allomuricauda sp.]